MACTKAGEGNGEVMALNENAGIWIEALKSGRWKQTKGHLAGAGEGFCCLGVACELFRRQTSRGRWEIDKLERAKDGSFRPDLRFVVERLPGDEDSSAEVLPFAVKEWLGLATASGEITANSSLAGLNDAGRSFGEIAALIESEPAGLFLRSDDPGLCPECEAGEDCEQHGVGGEAGL